MQVEKQKNAYSRGGCQTVSDRIAIRQGKHSSPLGQVRLFYPIRSCPWPHRKRQSWSRSKSSQFGNETVGSPCESLATPQQTIVCAYSASMATRRPFLSRSSALPQHDPSSRNARMIPSPPRDHTTHPR